MWHDGRSAVAGVGVWLGGSRGRQSVSARHGVPFVREELSTRLINRYLFPLALLATGLYQFFDLYLSPKNWFLVPAYWSTIS